MIVLGLCGSPRRGSYNRRLLEAAAAELPRGVTFDVFEGLADVPPYDQDSEDRGAPEAVRALRDAIAAADAVLIATPEYNPGPAVGARRPRQPVARRDPPRARAARVTRKPRMHDHPRPYSGDASATRLPAGVGPSGHASSAARYAWVILLMVKVR
ncbi:MAG: NAD(P)H-dependent oxidoreductase [Chloroflexi bacterium]|nr:NAD(P)H-dependent oxidoreductase [Chloroflexota bacterium]